MTEAELKRILNAIDTAIEVYQENPGTLTVTEVSIKSMLMVLRSRVAEQLNRERIHGP